MKTRIKKSETLQVRLPHGMKTAFMQRCEVEGRSASDLIRDFIEGYLARPVEILSSEKAVMIRRRFVYPSLAAALLTAAVIAFLPSASVASTLRAEFDAMDVDGDGAVSAQEYIGPTRSTGLGDPILPASVAKANIGGGNGMPPSLSIVRYNGKIVEAKLAGVAVTEDEIQTYLLSRLDADGDGKLSFTEYQEARIRYERSAFDRADRNLDEQVSRDEYLASNNMHPSILATMTPEQRARLGETTSDREKRIADFVALDADHDGSLSRSEMIPN